MTLDERLVAALESLAASQTRIATAMERQAQSNTDLHGGMRKLTAAIVGAQDQVNKELVPRIEAADRARRSMEAEQRAAALARIRAEQRAAAGARGVADDSTT